MVLYEGVGLNHDIYPRRTQGEAPQAVGATVLLVSDGEEPRTLPDEPFRKAGLTTARAASLAEAKALCSSLRPCLVFLPLKVAGEPTAPILGHCLGRDGAPVVVVIASHDEINAAAEAMRAGAFDCLFLPFSPGRLTKTIDAALEAMPTPIPPRSAPAAPRAAGDAASEPGPMRVLAASSDLRALLARARTLAASQAPVIVTGEVGTGKSLFAHEIRAASPRAHRPLVTLDAPTLTAEQLDAAGQIGAAEGTLVIEEICELDGALQSRLLALIDGRVGNPGAPRIVATTRHDPRLAIDDGRLNAALYYRLNVATLALPPLRGRSEDIGLIARTRLADFARAEGREITGFSDAAMELLAAHDWPGNTRELVNLVWSLVLTQDGPEVSPDALPFEIVDPAPARETAAPASDGTSLVGLSLAEIERRVIEATIAAEGGSVPRAARVLDVSPSTLYRKREAWTKDPHA
jgi:two-component system, repressor protein LuxO